MLGIPLHFYLVHFPIALTIMAAVCDVRAYTGKRSELHQTGYTLILWASAGAAFAAISGLQMLGARNAAVFATIHAALGLGTGLVLIAVAMTRYSAKARQSESGTTNLQAWLILELIAAVGVLAAAITGHRLVLGLVGLH